MLVAAGLECKAAEPDAALDAVNSDRRVRADTADASGNGDVFNGSGLGRRLGSHRN